MMIETVEQYLDIPIHHYFSLNMDGMADLVDAIGGITVENEFAFTAEKIDYPEGTLELDGWEALQYTRMRKDDPEGSAFSITSASSRPSIGRWIDSTTSST